MSVWVFLILWWIVGFLFVQLSTYRVKKNFFTEDDFRAYTVRMLFEEMIMAWLGPVMLILMIAAIFTENIDSVMDYELRPSLKDKEEKDPWKK